MKYKNQLEDMVRKIDVLTRLRVYQARDFDSPWFEGKYYGPISSQCHGIITLTQQP